MPKLEVITIVLAAGASQRMGRRNKLVLDVAGKPLFLWALDEALASKSDGVCLVLGPEMEQFLTHLHNRNVTVVRNNDYPEGMSTSIKAGLKALPQGVDGVLLTVADQPCLSAATFDKLIDKFISDAAPLIAAEYDGDLRNPALFHRDFFAELMQLQGDAGAKSILNKYAEQVATVPLSMHACLDIDTPEDLKRVERVLAARRQPGESA